MVNEIERVRESETNVVQTTPDGTVSRHAAVNRIASIVWYLVGVVVAILLVRVILAILGANLDNPFANFVYMISDPFVSPFRGLLQVGEFQAGVSRLELETLVAAAIYMLIGWGIASAVRLASRR